MMSSTWFCFAEIFCSLWQESFFDWIEWALHCTFRDGRSGASRWFFNAPFLSSERWQRHTLSCNPGTCWPSHYCDRFSSLWNRIFDVAAVWFSLNSALVCAYCLSILLQWRLYLFFGGHFVSLCYRSNRIFSVSSSEPSTSGLSLW